MNMNAESIKNIELSWRRKRNRKIYVLVRGLCRGQREDDGYVGTIIV